MTTFLSNQSFDDPMGTETFASLWMALQNSYEGTNITRTVARLLHMYQPEDGLEAYERLLRTLYVLLGDFDSRGFKLLVSIIPPPKDIPEDTIEDVFEKAVGFIRMTTLPDSRFLDFGTDDDSSNQINNLDTDSNIENLIESSKSSFENKNEKLEQVDESSQQPLFIGYPSQTYVISNHCNTTTKTMEDEEIVQPPGTSSDYRMKWIYTPYTLRKNAICQSTHLYNENSKITVNQKVQGPGEEDFCEIEDMSNVFKKPELINIPRKRGSMKAKKKCPEMKSKSMRSKKIDKKLSKDKQNKIVTLKSLVEEQTTISFKTEKRLRRKLRRLQKSIQEDIYKMDVVQPNKEEIEIIPVRKKKQKFVEPSVFDINNNLSRSIKQFLHRVNSEEETPKTDVDKVQIVTPSNNDPISDETAAFIDCWKKIITKSVLGRDPEPEDLCSADVSKEKITSVKKKGSGVKKESEKKVNRKKANASKRLKGERTSIRSRKRAKIEERENLPADSVINTEHISNSDFNNLVFEESNISSQTMICESNSGNMIQKTDSIPEITNYKQYYDPLLTIQNAEDSNFPVTLANSSPSTSKEIDYNHYYFDYLQREYQLLEQRLSIGTQLSDDQVQLQLPFSSSISNHHFSINSWTKSKSKNWSFPSFKQSQCPQHHLPVCMPAVNPPVFNFVPEENVSIEIIDCEEHEFNQLANDPNVVQQNLEDIFVVMKEPENVSIQQSSN